MASRRLWDRSRVEMPEDHRCCDLELRNILAKEGDLRASTILHVVRSGHVHSSCIPVT